MTTTEQLEAEIKRILLVFRGWTKEETAQEELPDAVSAITALIQEARIEEHDYVLGMCAAMAMMGDSKSADIIVRGITKRKEHLNSGGSNND